MKITREKFKEATGREPEHDDLDRVNCPHAGAMGHICCGWNLVAGLPQFELWPLDWNGKPMPAIDGQERIDK